MYSAQVRGISFHATDSRGDENMGEQLIENIARDIAQRQQGWDPVDQLSGEDITLLSKTIAGLRAPPISKLRRANSSIITAVLDVVNETMNAPSNLQKLERLKTYLEAERRKRSEAGVSEASKRKREKDRQLLKFHDQHPMSGKKKKPRR